MYADPEDLELIKQAAVRRGVPEAEILREAVKLAAMGARLWEEPLIGEDETFDLGGAITDEDIHRAVERTVGVKSARA
ncbi:MAG: CopG family transcriptional regulator [Solirubrobacteraceae bacterium]